MVFLHPPVGVAAGLELVSHAREHFRRIVV